MTKFEKGGLIKEGDSHARGGAVIEAERNEFVVRKDIVKKKGNLKFLEDFNDGKINVGDLGGFKSPSFSVPIDYIGGSLPSMRAAEKEVRAASQLYLTGIET